MVKIIFWSIWESFKFYSSHFRRVAIWGRALNNSEIQKLYNDYSYSWSPGGETTSSITAKPTSNTTYTVDITSGTTTCQSDVTISLNPSPTVDLGNDVTICSGTAQTLDAGHMVLTFGPLVQLSRLQT